MALQKSIINTRTGHANTYWRLTGCSIDAFSGSVQIVLSGYTDVTIRGEGYQPDDRRDWYLSGVAFAAVATAQAIGATVYDVVAAACYGVIKTERRPIPAGTIKNADGSLTLPDGGTVAAGDVDESGQVPTIPSEFADAVDA